MNKEDLNKKTKESTEDKAEDLMHQVRIAKAKMRKTERALALAVFKTTIRQFVQGWAILFLLLPVIAFCWR